jgi:hypothetical protein
MTELSRLSDLWIELKEAERKATEERREVEDTIMSLLDISEGLDGTENRKDGDYAIKIVGRMNRRVDTDRLQQLAAENGLTDHLSTLFRWKAEINSSIWKASDSAITQPLLDAITTTPGRPSFTITKE